MVGLVEGTIIHHGAVSIKIVEKKYLILWCFSDILENGIELVLEVNVEVDFLDAGVDFGLTQQIVFDATPAFVDFPLQVLGALRLIVFRVVFLNVGQEFLCEIVFLLEAAAELYELELGGGGLGGFS